MNESLEGHPRRHREGLISGISVGFFFVLVGAIFVTTPNLFNKVLDFFRDFDIVHVPNTGIYLPAPLFPRTHSVVYTAVEKFSFAMGLFQIVILLLRFIVRSQVGKKAEAVSNLVFCIGVGYLTRTVLIETTRWFEFWAGIIMLLGLSLIVRALILAAAASTKRTTQ